MHWNALLLTTLLSIVPVVLALGALASTRQPCEHAWRTAKIATSCGLLLAAVLLGLGVFQLLPAVSGVWLTTPLHLIMLLLANFIGFVVIRYSATYLQGEPRQKRFIALAQTDSSRCPSSLIFFVVCFAWMVGLVAANDAGMKRARKRVITKNLIK